jgi:uncharacterized protein (DUF849 family)
MEKLIVTAALTGNVTIPTQTSYLPTTPEQIADEAVRAAEAGAASIHIHARDLQAKPTNDTEVYRDIARRIKSKCNAIVCTSTGGLAGTTAEQRVAVVPALQPEIATCNMGSINLTVHPIAERYKDEDYKYPWEKEFILSTRDFVFRNTFGDLEVYLPTMSQHNTKAELEVYDVGHIYNIAYFVKKGFIKPPLWIQFVTGILGGIASTPEDILHLRQTADRVLGADNYKWSVIGMGFPAEFNMVTLGIIMGGNVRVGMEDNIFISKGVLTKSNAELVEKAVRIAGELGREIATPDEARAILGLKGRDKVNF